MTTRQTAPPTRGARTHRHGGHGSGEPTNSARRLAAEIRQRQAWELRLGGATLDEVARALGIVEVANPRAAAADLIDAWRRKVRTVDVALVNEEREMQASRLDRLLLDLWGNRMRRAATSDRDEQGNRTYRSEPDLLVFDRILRVLARQARLLGLDDEDTRDESRISILAEQAESIARALDDALVSMQVSEEQRLTARRTIAARLRVIEGEAVRLGERAS